MTDNSNLITYKIIPYSTTSNNMIIFVGNGNREFGYRVAQHFPNCLSSCYIERFSDGEIKIPKIDENIRQRHCVIIQTTGISSTYSINELIMELFIMIDAIKRGSASSITVVLPIFPYQRQDRKNYSRAPISASVISSFLEKQGVSRVICCDLHAEQIQGFFDRIPLDNLYCEPFLLKYITEHFSSILPDGLIIVSPDEGGTKRATRIAKRLDCVAAIMYKDRKKANEINNMVLMGDVEGKVCFIVDDIIDTAGTACHACDVLIEKGAKEVYMGATHGILSGDAILKINKSKFKKIVITNTLEINERYGLNPKIEILDVSELVASAIDRSLSGKSLSELMEL
jgi:ribose-phosphate pyrophosphokinase